MNRTKWNIFFVTAICLVLIASVISASVLGVFREENGVEPKEVSVILYFAGVGGWESMQEGINRAGNDFSMNINYCILKEGTDAKEQLAVIEREVANGADGIILAVSDYHALYELWLERGFQVPVVTVESGFNESTIPLITADNYEMGKMLGEEIRKDFSDREQVTVALVEPTGIKDSVELREKGFRDALEGSADIITCQNAEDSAGADAMAALDKESLLYLAGTKTSVPEETKYYGIGNTSAIVAALDQGKIDKLIFQNEFNLGYLAMDTLRGVLEGTGDERQEAIDFYCVKREEIYSTPYEQLLFPIVE